MRQVTKIGAEDSLIYIVKELFTKSEAYEMLEKLLSDKSLLRHASQESGGFDTINIFGNNVAICQEIITRLEDVLTDTFGGIFLPITLPDSRTSIKIQREGESHRLHSDSGISTWSGDTEGEQLLFSAVVSLSDNYDGGETQFPYDDVKVRLDAGSAIIYSSVGHAHMVTEVTEGKRYTFLTFWEKIN